MCFKKIKNSSHVIVLGVIVDSGVIKLSKKLNSSTLTMDKSYKLNFSS